MWHHINSPQNQRIRKAARLRDRRGRQQQQRIIVDGVREIGRALQQGVQPLELFVRESSASEPVVKQIAHSVSNACRMAVVDDSVFRKLAFGDRSEGIVLVAAAPAVSLAALSVENGATVCVLEGVEKPGNVGAIVRSADAAGVAAVIVADGRTDLYNPNAIRASLGAVFSMPYCAAPSVEVRQWLRDNGFRTYAARVDGAVSYDRIDYPKRTAFVLGSEAIGLTEAWSGPDTTAISLPMLGVVDSLNVSVTAAVLFYESLKNRRIELDLK